MNRTFGGGDDATLAPAAQPSGPVERSSTLPIGTVLAERYQIIDVLGIGGMGAVYRAFDRKLTRVVALKTILPELAATPSARAFDTALVDSSPDPPARSLPLYLRHTPLLI